MQNILEMDLEDLAKATTSYSRDHSQYRYLLLESQKVRCLYWAHQLICPDLTKILKGLKDREFILLAEIAKKIALFSQNSHDFHLSINTLTRVIEVIEEIHRTRYDHKLRYLRKHPKLLIEAKAELRRKEPELIEH